MLFFTSHDHSCDSSRKYTFFLIPVPYKDKIPKIYAPTFCFFVCPHMAGGLSGRRISVLRVMRVAAARGHRRSEKNRLSSAEDSAASGPWRTSALEGNLPSRRNTE